MSTPTLRIGCAGWSIARADAARFPVDGSQLERYAQVFNAVEINSSFYRPHLATTWRRWGDAVPAHFHFAVKMPRAISHYARLRDCNDELATFLDAVHHLGERLGCLLLQLPPSLVFDATVALPFFEQLRDRHAGAIACEPRHASWFTTTASVALRERHIARVAADPPRWPRAAVPAGDHALRYLRLHGSPRMYYDVYADATLQRIAQRLKRAAATHAENWCMFDNTALGHATRNALTMQRMVAMD